MGQDQDQANDIAQLKVDVAALLDAADHEVAYDTNETVTVSSAAIGLTETKHGNRSHAVIYCEVAAVRYWSGESVPTSSVGIELSVGDTLFLNSHQDIANISFIRRDGSDATLRCEYGH